MPRSPHEKIFADRLFFPAAALYAAAAVPLSVLSMTSAAFRLPGLTAAGHAHEMLFGFALALVAGYAAGPMPAPRLFALFGVWALARPAFVFAPFIPASGALNALFAVMLAWHVVPRFMAAKKWRNRLVSPLLLVLCALAVLYTFAPGTSLHLPLSPVTVLALALLMAFMGGRIIAPAAAGESERRGLPLEARVQPRVEAALIVLVAAAAILLLAGQREAAGAAAVAAGVLIALRLLRWRLWRCRRRPDLLGLGAGYAWLALGLTAIGAALVTALPLTAAIHLVTVGALGTLSTGVMARVHFQRLRRQAPPVLTTVTAALIAAAATGRAAAALTPENALVLLWCAAAAWSAAYLFLAFHLLKRR